MSPHLGRGQVLGRNKGERLRLRGSCANRRFWASIGCQHSSFEGLTVVDKRDG